MNCMRASPWRRESAVGCFLAAAGLIAMGPPASVAAPAAARPSPATVAAWDRYFAWADGKVKEEVADPDRFLIEDSLSPSDRAHVKRRLESGGIVVHKRTGIIPAGTKLNMPDGELHHWWGAILVPGARLPALITFLQDYGNHAGRFADVVRSQMLRRDGDHFEFYFRLRRTKAFVTVTYNTEQYCDYFNLGRGRIWSRSVATKIAELADVDTPQEREKPPGQDRGFLWRLASWWRFQETDRGVIVECESASLSRDIPTLIRLIPGVAGYIRSMPRESLESILATIRRHAESAP
ncbi:MAG: hypothetical protein HXY20_14320 [Acidobacteria bacterium]|nr:hypothetical protein [Acidobacteriota bacterium]